MVGKTPEIKDEEAGAAALIERKIAELGDWRGKMLARLRQLVHEADPETVEEVKWRKPTNPLGVAAWSHHGLVCTGETYKDKVKLTFAYGASVDDPDGLFNSSLDGGTRRAIDFGRDDAVDPEAFKALYRRAVAFNAGKKKR